MLSISFHLYLDRVLAAVVVLLPTLFLFLKSLSIIRSICIGLRWPPLIAELSPAGEVAIYARVLTICYLMFLLLLPFVLALLNVLDRKGAYVGKCCLPTGGMFTMELD